MGKVVAKGKKHGFNLTVEYESDNILFNGKRDELLNDELLSMLEEPKSVGGSYYPTEDSLLNVYNILQYHFFDEPADEITVEGEIEEIPYEEGKVY